MAKTTLPSITILFLILFSTTLPPTIHSFSYSQYESLLSLSHSLLMRVANLRAARGDLAGAAWAKGVAEKLERGLRLGFWGWAWSAGWDYLKNYGWRNLEYREINYAISDVNELMGFLGELTQTKSDVNRAAWVAQNYGNVLAISNRMLCRLLKVYTKSGALREMVETMQKEVVEGGLLKDCLEIGSNDLKAMLQIFKDLALQFYSTPSDDQEL